MKKVIKLKESDLIKIVKNIISEETVGNEQMLCTAIMGYLDKHGDDIMNDIFPDKMAGLTAKKEVMVYCEFKRDNRPVKPLSKRAQALYNTVEKMVKSSPNIMDYSNVGKNIKHV
jgi:hypothetical protein